MNGRDEELLSAYFDGELPDAEKSRAEQLLADDLAARELLADVGEVSGWIRALPRTIDHDGTLPAVMARIQVVATRQSAANTVLAPRSSWRRRALWTTVTAAGLVLAVVLQRNWPGPQAQVRDDRVVTTDGVADGTEPVSVTEQPVAAGAFAAMAITPSEPVAVDTWNTAILNAVDIQQRLAGALERGEAPVAGEERADLAEIGDRVVVIRYRVVDHIQLPGKVQVVLTNNGITEVTGEPSVAESQQLGTSDARQLTALYVEAPESEFQSALATFTTLDGVTEVTTNFVATATAESAEGATLLGAPLSNEASDRPEEPAAGKPRALAFDAAPASGESSGFAPASPATAETDDRQDLKLADEYAPEDRPYLPGRHPSEAVPPAAQAPAAPLARGYQVAVPAEKELMAELQGEEGETKDREDRGVQEPRLAGALSRSGAPAQRQNYFFNESRGTATSPARDMVRAVILLVPE